VKKRREGEVSEERQKTEGKKKERNLSLSSLSLRSSLTLPCDFFSVCKKKNKKAPSPNIC